MSNDNISDEEKRARRKCRERLSCVLGAVGQAACNCKIAAEIPLIKTSEGEEEIILANLVLGKLEKMNFKIYRCDGKYHAVWNDRFQVPKDFERVTLI